MSCADHSFYQYSPLLVEGSIRLLKLLPGQTNDTIDCTLVQVKLEDGPNYEALSYAWGDPEDKAIVRCDGKIVMVPRNLKDALHRLKLREESRILWADAICINQDDDVEKGPQVGLMARIYGDASKVCVWLGCTTIQMQPAFTLINAILSHGRDSTTNRAELPHFSTEYWTALELFFSATWFTRLWIVQEVYGHACTVFYGEHEIPWNDMVLVARMLLRASHTSKLSNAPLSQMPNAIAVLQIESAGDVPKTSSIFDVFRYFNCTNQRDKVYALLSFPPLCNLQPPIQPDYTKSVSEVFEEATVRISTFCENLGLLSSLEHDQTIDEEWPSWVPRWDRPRTTQILHSYASGRVNSSLFRAKFRPKSLISKGTLISKVSWCGSLIEKDSGESTHEKHQVDSLREPLLEWLAEILPRMTHPTDSVILSIAMTLTVGLDYESNCPPVDLSQFRCDFLAYLKRTVLLPDITGVSEDWSQALMAKGMAGDSSSFHAAAIRGCKNKRLFCTYDGDFGIGPRAAQVGDHIVLLHGSNAPSILRKRGLHYQFVGECYVHEQMHGEAIKDAEENTASIEEYELR